MTWRTSRTPAVTAESSTNLRPDERAIAWASVVLPVPGGPQRITETEPRSPRPVARERDERRTRASGGAAARRPRRGCVGACARRAASRRRATPDSVFDHAPSVTGGVRRRFRACDARPGDWCGPPRLRRVGSQEPEKEQRGNERPQAREERAARCAPTRPARRSTPGKTAPTHARQRHRRHRAGRGARPRGRRAARLLQRRARYARAASRRRDADPDRRARTPATCPPPTSPRAAPGRARSRSTTSPSASSSTARPHRRRCRVDDQPDPEGFYDGVSCHRLTTDEHLRCCSAATRTATARAAPATATVRSRTRPPMASTPPAPSRWPARAATPTAWAASSSSSTSDTTLPADERRRLHGHRSGHERTRRADAPASPMRASADGATDGAPSVPVDDHVGHDRVTHRDRAVRRCNRLDADARAGRRRRHPEHRQGGAVTESESAPVGSRRRDGHRLRARGRRRARGRSVPRRRRPKRRSPTSSASTPTSPGR